MGTIPGFLSASYGRGTGNVAVIASVAGTFISIIAQFLSAAAMLKGVFPVQGRISLLLAGILVLSFIYLGGLKSFSAIGVGKIALLYITLLVCAAVSLWKVLTHPAPLPALPFHPFFSLFGQGFGDGASAGISLVAGVLCTQIYIQAVFSASSPGTARKGALLSAFLMPPLGLLGIIVGLSMRSTGVEVESATALSYFIAANFSPLTGGLLWSGILITVIGTAAGLTLGVATNLVFDIPVLSRLARNRGEGSSSALRSAVLLLVAAAGIAGAAAEGSMILKWSYLSMGLRASGTVFPLAAAILFPGGLSPRMALASGSAGLMVTLLWPLAGTAIDPLFAGLAVSGGLAWAGLHTRGKNRNTRPEV
jgi:SSS family solute:Na+ symporter